MDLAVHAHLMAGLCKSSFAQLICEVPTRYASDQDLARKLISAVCHADKMANLGRPPVPAMIFELADKLFHAARSECFGIQNEAMTQLIRIIMHANNMAQIVPEVTEDLLALVRPLIDETIPTNQAVLDGLTRQLDEISAQIRSICHEAQMRRIIASS